jgi:hypothetical protein
MNGHLDGGVRVFARCAFMLHTLGFLYFWLLFIFRGQGSYMFWQMELKILCSQLIFRYEHVGEISQTLLTTAPEQFFSSPDARSNSRRYVDFLSIISHEKSPPMHSFTY